MSKKTRITIASIMLVLLLSACQLGGGDNIVGRWEFGDQDFGIAYEFYEDGTGVMSNSLDPFYPMAGDFIYTYNPESGVLKVTTSLTESMDRTILYLITFVSENEISVEQSGMSKPYPYIRKPLPELPGGARARLGGMMLGQSFTFIDAEKLEPGWEKKYNDYVIVARTDIEITIGENVEEWLVTLQIEGEADTSLYVLHKGEGRWGVLQLIKND
jgi:hypothetical protein